MKRKLRSKEQINRLLLDAANEEFSRFGFNGATTAAIASRATVTEAQLFRHFPTKGELFRAAVFEPLCEHLANFNEQVSVVASEKLPEADSQRYIAELMAFLESNSGLLLALHTARQSDRNEASGIDESDSLNAYFEQGAQLFRKNQKRRSDSNYDPDIMVRLPFAALLGLVLFKELIFSPEQFTDETVDKSIADFLIAGIDGMAAN